MNHLLIGGFGVALTLVTLLLVYRATTKRDRLPRYRGYLRLRGKHR